MVHKAVCGVAAGAFTALTGVAVAGAGQPAPAEPPPSPEPWYLADRGTGVPTSMFGTYIRRGELIVYPFYEYYRDDDLEYEPSELGHPGDQDFRGRYRAHEGLLLLAYGVTDDIALELETAVIDASLEKSPLDTSTVPPRIEESGLGDVEAQLRWRFGRETASRPELFSFLEAVLPHAEDKVLIGTPGWELKLGAGFVKGYRFGTLSARVAVEYDEASSSEFDLGEYAVEFLKRVSPRFRVFLGVEGSQDEVSLIAELQTQLSRHVFLKLNSGFGITPKATDWAPEVGLLFTLPTRRAPR
jgi:hypothetical protein